MMERFRRTYLKKSHQGLKDDLRSSSKGKGKKSVVRMPLKAVENISSEEDIFEEMKNEPSTQEVSYKPMSFWKNKVKAVEDKENQKSFDTDLDLYTFISYSDESTSSSTKPRRKHKKKKQNCLDVYKLTKTYQVNNIRSKTEPVVAEYKPHPSECKPTRQKSEKIMLKHSPLLTDFDDSTLIQADSPTLLNDESNLSYLSCLSTTVGQSHLETETSELQDVSASVLTSEDSPAASYSSGSVTAQKYSLINSSSRDYARSSLDQSVLSLSPNLSSGSRSDPDITQRTLSGSSNLGKHEGSVSSTSSGSGATKFNKRLQFITQRRGTRSSNLVKIKGDVSSTSSSGSSLSKSGRRLQYITQRRRTNLSNLVNEERDLYATNMTDSGSSSTKISTQSQYLTRTLRSDVSNFVTDGEKITSSSDSGSTKSVRIKRQNTPLVSTDSLSYQTEIKPDSLTGSTDSNKSSPILLKYNLRSSRSRKKKQFFSPNSKSSSNSSSGSDNKMKKVKKKSINETKGKRTKLRSEIDITLLNDTVKQISFNMQTMVMEKGKKKTEIDDSECLYFKKPNMFGLKRGPINMSLVEDGELSVTKTNMDVGYRRRTRAGHRMSCNKTLESSLVQNLGNKTLNVSCFQNCTIIKPGKKYKRDLTILYQLQEGNITLLDNTVVDDVGRKGRNYLKLVEEVVEQQKAAPNNTKLNDTYCERTTMMSTLHSATLLNETRTRVIPDNNFDVTIRPTMFQSVYGIGKEFTNEVSKYFDCNETLDEPIAKDVVMNKCNQQEPLPFEEYYNERKLTNCTKIGEGVYGEVFVYTSDKEKIVLKIIPIEGEMLVNGERQKSFDEVLTEIVITMELSNLRNESENSTSGFVNLVSCRCVRGQYPDYLIQLWDEYDKKKGSENDSPTIFQDEQLYIVFELANGGLDMEAFVFKNSVQAKAALDQIALSLAVAESALDFEHRDLHWGNVLVSPTTKKFLTYTLNGQSVKLPTKGIQTCIIDFSLSRMSYDSCILFQDLSADEELFTANGDYQFEIYRMMRQNNNNDWSQFQPKSNIFWLDYLADKTIKMLRYKEKITKQHRMGIEELKTIKSKMLNNHSAAQYFKRFLLPVHRGSK